MSSEELASDHGGDTSIYTDAVDANAVTSENDAEMFPARSQVNTHSQAQEGRNGIGLKSQEGDVVNNTQEEINGSDLDLLPRIHGLFRLLDLISEQGVAGTVDKIIIPEDSVAKFLNEVSPKSFASMTQIDFAALDKSSVSPIGVYGSKSALIGLLLKAQCIDEKVAQHLESYRPNELNNVPALRPGLYLLDVRHVHPGLVYIIFWPEDTTWDDNASATVSKNREMFIRFLTKLCDQIVALISEEHGERLAFKSRNADTVNGSGSFGHSSRLFEFEVEQTTQQEETAAASEGIKLKHPCIARVTHGPPDFDLDRLQPTIIVGGLYQAILSVEYIAPQSTKKPISRPMHDLHFKDFLLGLRDSRIALSEDIDFGSLKILLENGLRERHQELYNSWENSWEKKGHASKLNISKRESEEWLPISISINDTRNRLQNGITPWLIGVALEIYPEFDKEVLIAASPLHSTSLPLSTTDLDILEKKRIREQIQSILVSIDQPHTKYSILKERFLEHRHILKKGPKLSAARLQQFIDLLPRGDDYEEELRQIFESEEKHAMGGWLSSSRIGRTSTSRPQTTDDHTFLKCLQRLRLETPAYNAIIETIFYEAWCVISERIQGLAQTLPETVTVDLLQDAKNDLRDRIGKQCEEESMAELRALIREALRNEPEDGRPLVHIRRISSTKSYRKATYHIDGNSVEAVGAGVRYQINMLDLKAEDLQGIVFNPYHIPKPAIRSGQPPCFVLPLSHIIRFIRLLKDDRCLLVVQATEDKLEVFLDSVYALNRAVYTSPKKTFHLHKLGSQPLFALDETKRLLALYSVNEERVHITPYIFEATSNNLYPRGGSIDITRWFEGPPVPQMRHFVFLSNSEDLLLVDETGLARIFSLVTEQFRPATRHLGSHIISVQSTSDGNAFLAVGRESDPFSLTCYHMGSFGTSSGTPVTWPSGVVPSNSIVISSLGCKEALHGFIIDRTHQSVSSVLLHITSRTSEYAFRARVDNGIDPVNRMTLHNSIIDCHRDVWTRYPVQATIQREMAPGTKHRPRSLTFISTHHRDLFSGHFKSLIKTFEAKSHKPTQGQLANIMIGAHPGFDPLAPAVPISEFKAGDWVVGLFCLIPIHIAVAKQNRFVPLRNGVLSQDFEQSLLGADVTYIAESLTLGWYESILASYMAQKPIRVVTSMGEQSVGKSYCLNHFVDSSFAGSAMRCTEGVWLSVTPTREAVIVSMDFEGVNSIERSAQEDTLLVLFNAAISNLVLFRNNFALSRDIAKSFKSFQSSTKVLDPTANPSLFQSTLAIIIKDVIDFDTTEIVNEFSLKFRRIVQQEAGDNFISKLHRGKLAIIPWPVIQSPQFYELFESLKSQFMRQPTTHQSTGEFVLVLKMLMAKLKACDWGALDQNLAVQRVNHLAPSLIAALTLGVVDPETRTEPLKNLDTDEEIPSSTPGVVFYIPDAHPMLSPASCLSALRASWTGYQRRFKISEIDFIEAFNQYLQDIANRRIQQVRTWLEQNTARFPRHADIQSLFRRFDELTKGMKAEVILCAAQCGSCGLLCLGGRYHDGPHDCQTTHKCHRVCEFTDQHEDDSTVPICDMPAGHNGYHVCQEKPHRCGQPCRLESKAGCLHKCCKPIGHEEEEHLCAARTHACGAPCSLQAECSADGRPLCLRFCVADCEEGHERHCCSLALSCPAQCQLCKSFCSTGNHFHALQTGAVHLCGQSHACPRQCEIRGICHVDTTPRSIETTFVGRYGPFQYTKYTQEARRLPCIVPIPSNELEHPGQHIHSTVPDAVHFCNVRCELCDYYCTYPLGHPQREHWTSHGSMSNSIWFVHGDEDHKVEVEGRKYAAGDSGAPMLCSLVCKNLRRHIHVDNCRADEDGVCGGGDGVQHLNNSYISRPQDLITHRLFWERSGFRDPYTQEEQADFDLCDHKCRDDGHNPVLHRGAKPSYCNLPLFHPPVQEGDVTFNTVDGYVSRNGHAFACKNPAQMRRAFHIIFVVDRSGSMLSSDHQPLSNTPMSNRVSTHHNNRYGAALSALYSFWSSREVTTRQGVSLGVLKDSYSIVLFDHTSEVILENNDTSTPDELVEGLIGGCRYWFQGTNFNRALATARTVLEQHWDTQRVPVIIFLSDGECSISDEIVYDLCRSAVRAGSALLFHAVSFGSPETAGSLCRMVQIANEIYGASPRGPLPPIDNPCSYSEALDTIQLADAFLAIADSLHNPQATLKRI